MRDNEDRLIELNRSAAPRRAGGPKAINLPPVTTAIILALIAIFAVDRLIGSWTGIRYIAEFFAFYGLSFDPLSLMQLFTYSLIHYDLGHLAMNVVGLAVLGKVLEPALGRNKLVAMLALGSAAGALVHIGLGDYAILIGISAGVGALYGVALPHAWNGRFGRLDKPIVLLSMFFLITSFLGLVTGLMGSIAHAAHIGGFLAGLLLSHQVIKSAGQIR